MKSLDDGDDTVAEALTVEWLTNLPESVPSVENDKDTSLVDWGEQNLKERVPNMF